MEELEISQRKEKKQSIWVEKYRPKSMDEFIGNDFVKSTFETYIKNQDFPHLLLVGKPGVGKTSMAKMLIKSINCDAIYINASDENGIDTIRDKIKSFASSCGFKPLKVLILDECDGLTFSAMASLRPIMEMYSLHTRFILTGNYQERISDPIKSRVQMFEISPPSKSDVAKHLVGILKNENISFTKEEVVNVVNGYYPDIRKVIQFAQQCSMSGTLMVPKTQLIGNDVNNKILDMIKSRSQLVEFRKYVLDQGLMRFDGIYDFLYENVDNFADGKQSSVIINIADAVKSDAIVANKQIIFIECIINILRTLKG